MIRVRKSDRNESIGVELVGGNAAGIFVRDIAPGSALGRRGGLLVGDQILDRGLILFLSSTILDWISSYNGSL